MLSKIKNLTRSQEFPHIPSPTPTQKNVARSKNRRQKTGSKASDPPLKPLSSSSSKPPPVHPILKKTRGPSASGPKPTARFVTPHESAEEDEGSSIFKKPEGRVKLNGRTMGSHSETSGTTQQGKKAVATGRTEHPASSASKRRSQIPQRSGSQSPAGTSAASPLGNSNASPSPEGSRTRTINDSSPESRRQETSREITTRPKAEKLEQTARGKSLSASSPRESRRLPKLNNHDSPPIRSYVSPAARQGGTQSRSLDLMRSRRTPPSQASAMVRRQATSDFAHHGENFHHHCQTGLEPIVRSSSDTDRPPPRTGLTSGTTATTCSVTAQGTFGFEQPSVVPVIPGAKDEEMERAMHSPKLYPSSQQEMHSQVSFIHSRLTPTPPNPTPEVPLGRTKSQLVILLERDKSRLEYGLDGEESGQLF